jgi:hypothetical protein
MKILLGILVMGVFLPVQAFPPLPILVAHGAERRKEKCRVPARPMPPERNDKDVIAEKFSLLEPGKKRGLRRIVRRAKGKNKREEAHLRILIAQPNIVAERTEIFAGFWVKSGDVFQKFAHFMELSAQKFKDERKAHPLSVSYYKTCEEQGDVIRKKMMDECDALVAREVPDLSRLEPQSLQTEILENKLKPIIEGYQNRLGKLANAFGNQVMKIFPKGFDVTCYMTDCSGAFVFKMKESGLVLKIPNPYNGYPNHYLRRICSGEGGENHSLKRQVRRVSASAFINAEFSTIGLRAPQKRLCLKPGARIDGPINDRYCIVLAEFIEGDPASGEMSKFILDEQVDALSCVTREVKTNDFHDDNLLISRRSRALTLIDTERTMAFVSHDTSEGYLHAFLTNIKHPQIMRYVLGRYVDHRDFPTFFCTRIESLERLIPKDVTEDKRIELMRHWIAEYLVSLCTRGDITARQKEVLTLYYLGAGYEENYFSGFSEAERVARMAGLTRLLGEKWMDGFFPTSFTGSYEVRPAVCADTGSYDVRPVACAVGGTAGARAGAGSA